MEWGGKGITRRELLKAGTTAGLGLAASGGLWTPASAAETLIFTGWSYEPDLVRQNLDRFEKLYPQYKIDYTPTETRLYREKLVAMFQGGDAAGCALRAGRLLLGLGGGGLPAAD